MTKGWLNDDFDVPGTITGGGIQSTPIGTTTTAASAFTTLGVGTTVVPHGSVGGALLAIEGVNNSATTGPHMQFTTATDDYPLIQITPMAHDNVSMYFDGYRDSGGQKSSNSNGSFKIKKGNEVFAIQGEAGGTAGVAATFADLWKVTSGGIVTMPLQPCIRARNAVAQSNVTGGGTTHTVLFATELEDRNGDYASSTLTSPVTSDWLFTACIRVQGITSSETGGNIACVTSNYTQTQVTGNVGVYFTSGSADLYMSWISDMDAADTQTWTVRITGGTDVCDIPSASDQRTATRCWQLG